MNLGAVAWLLGRVILLMGLFQLVPAAVAEYYSERDDALAFLLSALIAVLLGLGLSAIYRGRALTSEGRPDFFRREGLAAVGLSWVAASVLGAIPFVLAGAIASPVDAFFESASGITTTGSTILPAEHLDALNRGVLFWRSFLHWLGGVGIVLVFVVFFPTGGRSLFRSEVPGVSREAAHTRVRDSALSLARVYVGLTVIQIGVLTMTGVGLYDATLHAFGTIATGGFSNHSASAGYFGSWAFEAVLIVFMFLAGINFALYDSILRRGWRSAWDTVRGSTEIRVYAGIMAAATVLITSVLWFWGGSNGVAGAADGLPDYSHLSLCLRDSMFSVVSIQTSTGFGTADFDRWPDLCRAVLMLLAAIGGCAGSTAGGIKVVRVLIVAKVALRSVQHFSRPRALHQVRIDGQTLDEPTIAMVTGYFGLWSLVMIAGTIALTALDVDLISASTAVLGTLNNIGPGLAAVGPAQTFADMPDLAKLLCSIFMILGRLEFYALVVLFLPRFWRS
ncbi:TrkH family potassium uptake protein [Engelhardtia mirabilis]|uniref:Trk system potassium uptake protein TrkG n=1 Tax=Engelhardtia mirabilis TaxID=2528011 RepID=A0A518BMB8_9BACT|nr:Trk system potassium uptake protein TrkG [Planctomycetes bacterium Pla133]QDV02412.1 Trk system potassium uptake protein TrkG [Planctomycetes bacterium Pla86]